MGTGAHRRSCLPKRISSHTGPRAREPLSGSICIAPAPVASGIRGGRSRKRRPSRPTRAAAKPGLGRCTLSPPGISWGQCSVLAGTCTLCARQGVSSLCGVADVYLTMANVARGGQPSTTALRSGCASSIAGEGGAVVSGDLPRPRQHLGHQERASDARSARPRDCRAERPCQRLGLDQGIRPDSLLMDKFGRDRAVGQHDADCGLLQRHVERNKGRHGGPPWLISSEPTGSAAQRPHPDETAAAHAVTCPFRCPGIERDCPATSVSSPFFFSDQPGLAGHKEAVGSLAAAAAHP